ncbi:hypothetical protein D9M70_638560 [compost metagenome]
MSSQVLLIKALAQANSLVQDNLGWQPPCINIQLADEVMPPTECLEPPAILVGQRCPGFRVT